jgi:manganese/iron transport system permease protein
MAGVTGMYLSYHLDLPSGPAIVMVVFSFFILAFLFSPTQGILTEPGTLRWIAKILQPLKLWKR